MKPDKRLCYVFVCFFSLDPAQTAIEFGMFWAIDQSKRFCYDIQLWCER